MSCKYQKSCQNVHGSHAHIIFICHVIGPCAKQVVFFLIFPFTFIKYMKSFGDWVRQLHAFSISASFGVMFPH